MRGTYDLVLVGLSIGVAVIASYVALDLASRVTASRGTPAARHWLAGGGFSMGIGIWSMHIIGMLAFRLPISPGYDTGGTLLSLLIAVIVSAFALWTVSRGTLSVERLLRAGICMGLGMVAMHYTGIESIEIEPSIRYEATLVIASIVIAVAASLIALWIAFALRSETSLSAARKRLAGALVMSGAIAGMHYTAMAAASFAPDSYVVNDPFSITTGASLAATIGAFTVVLLVATLIAAIVDARLADRSARMAGEIRKTNLALERRTAELSRANERLRQEAAERAHARRALQESEERYRTLTALSSDWTWEQDAELRFVSLSDKLPAYCGLAHEGHIGKTRWELPNSEPINTTWAEHKALLQAHKEFRNLLIKRIDAESKAHYACTSGSPIFDASGNFTGYRGVASDVTERLQAEERFRATFEQAAVGLAHVSLDGRHLMANRKYCQMLGYTQEELLALPTDAVTARDGPGALPALRADLIDGAIDHYSGEKKFFRKDGSPIWVNRTVSLARDARGEPLYYIRVIEDISERKAVDAARAQSSAEFGALFNQAAVGMAQTDMRGVFLRVNQKLCTMLGYSADELLGLKFQQITHVDDLQRNVELLRGFAAGELAEYTYEKRYVCKDGSPLWVSVTMSRVSTGPDASPTALAVIEDISQRKRAEERLMYLAQYDALTGLPNRTLVHDRLAQAIARARRSGQMLAVLFLDLDDFSDVNDSLGHAAGDRVLQTAAALLHASLREVDTIGRLGGDEFAIVLENVTGEDQATTVADKIKKAFLEPMAVDGREIFVSASVGIAVYPQCGETVDALLQSADVAMYHAKGQGRNAHAFASATMTAEASERFQTVALLRRGLERQEFALHYQPIVDLKSRAIIGAEALIRLYSEEHGLIPPGKFIALAEATGLIVPIGEWALKTACLQAKTWQAPGQPPVLVAVNLSARQLRTRGLVDTIARTLAETALAPALLKLEITESQIMGDAREVMETLAAMRALGVGLAMDDFGTGYSSLGNLAKLPVDVLKIDRAFVARMLDDSDAMALVSTILTLARSLRLKVVAEGVETEQQERALRLLRCDQMQGYLFSRPLPAAEFAALLAKHRSATNDAWGGSRGKAEKAGAS
ncbi:MAG TPA: EAL domain-containing protein [Casimicrobiaceae bacterium]